MTNIGGRDVGTNDLGVLASGAVAFVASLLPFYGVSYHAFGAGGSASFNAWHSYGFLGLLLVLAVAVLVALRVYGVFNLPKMPVGPALALLAAAGFGTLLLILRAFTYPSASGPGFSSGPKFGAYLLILAGIAMAVFCFLSFKESGETMPDFSTMKSAGSAPAAPPTYSPPPAAPPTFSPPPAAPPTFSPPPSPPSYPPPTPPTGGMTSE